MKVRPLYKYSLAYRPAIVEWEDIMEYGGGWSKLSEQLLVSNEYTGLHKACGWVVQVTRTYIYMVLQYRSDDPDNVSAVWKIPRSVVRSITYLDE